MTIFIKNMVCNRCISAVEDIFTKADVRISSVILGEVETETEISSDKMKAIEKELLETGFERIMDSAHQLVEKIKNLIIVKVSELDIADNFLLSEFLSSKLHKDY